MNNNLGERNVKEGNIMPNMVPGMGGMGSIMPNMPVMGIGGGISGILGNLLSSTLPMTAAATPFSGTFNNTGEALTIAAMQEKVAESIQNKPPERERNEGEPSQFMMSPERHFPQG